LPCLASRMSGYSVMDVRIKESNSGRPRASKPELSFWNPGLRENPDRGHSKLTKQSDGNFHAVTCVIWLVSCKYNLKYTTTVVHSTSTHDVDVENELNLGTRMQTKNRQSGRIEAGENVSESISLIQPCCWVYRSCLSPSSRVK